MARHAAADLSHILGVWPQSADPGSLAAADLVQLRTWLAEARIPLREGPEADKRLAHLRQTYEPYVSALTDRLLIPLLPWATCAGAKMSGGSLRGGRRRGLLRAIR
jgi:hypothetical protein